MKGMSLRKTVIVFGVVLLFVIGFFVIGLFIDIQIIIKLNYTPIPFTFILPFVGALIGLLLAFRIVRNLNGAE
jgi:hypothetical protein